MCASEAEHPNSRCKPCAATAFSPTAHEVAGTLSAIVEVHAEQLDPRGAANMMYALAKMGWQRDAAVCPRSASAASSGWQLGSKAGALDVNICAKGSTISAISGSSALRGSFSTSPAAGIATSQAASQAVDVSASQAASQAAGGQLVATLLQSCQGRLRRLNNQEIANLLWSLGKLGQQPGEAWMSEYFEVVRQV